MRGHFGRRSVRGTRRELGGSRSGRRGFPQRRRAVLGLLATVFLVALIFGASVGLTATSQTQLQVRVITPTKVTLGSWDPANYRSYTQLARKRKWELYVAEAVPHGEATAVLTRWGQEGVDVVFSTSSGFQPFMLRAAAQFPNTRWVTLSDLTTTNNLPNVAAYGADWCQLGFVQGVVAALASKTGKIGAVGTLPILPAIKTLAGMRIGANAVRRGTDINAQYVGNFTDALKAGEVTSALLAQGSDVIIAIATGGLAPAIAARAQSRGKFYIGSYDNEARFAPKTTVTSVALVFGIGYERVARQTLAGKFKTGIFRMGLRTGYVKLHPFRLLKNKEARAKAVVRQAVERKFDRQFAACNALKR